MVVEIFFFFFNLMREIKGEGCCKAKKPGRKIMDFKVTKTVTTLPFINCVICGITSQNLFLVKISLTHAIVEKIK